MIGQAVGLIIGRIVVPLEMSLQVAAAPRHGVPVPRESGDCIDRLCACLVLDHREVEHPVGVVDVFCD